MASKAVNVEDPPNNRSVDADGISVTMGDREKKGGNNLPGG